MTKIKVIRKKKSKNIDEKNIDEKNIDEDNDDDYTIESSFKLLNKRVLKIQNNNIKNITISFIKNDGYVALSVY